MTRHRLLPLACALLLPLTACGSDPRPSASPDSAVSTPSAVAVTSAGPSASPAASGTTPSPSGSRPAAQRAASPTTTAAPDQTRNSGTAAPTTAASTSAPISTAAGQYTYTAKGTVTVGTPQPVDGKATLTVDPVAGGQQHSVLEGDQGRTEQDVVLRSDGRFLASLDLTNPAFSKQFRPDPPVLLLPAPATVGRSWTWRATSTDSKTNAEASNQVVRRETLTVNGEKVTCAVVETTLVLSGDIAYRGTTTTWVSDRYRLPVKDRSRGSGTVNGVAFSTDITTALQSTRPA
ncbi:MAG: hypothetical protein H7323_07235 [Frankiales bacterium]|nr:hypothetical protein [Frankiales bacterium]